jgi:hypothetical protein
MVVVKASIRLAIFSPGLGRECLLLNVRDGSISVLERIRRVWVVRVTAAVGMTDSFKSARSRRG